MGDILGGVAVAGAGQAVRGRPRGRRDGALEGTGRRRVVAVRGLREVEGGRGDDVYGRAGEAGGGAVVEEHGGGMDLAEIVARLGVFKLLLCGAVEHADGLRGNE